MPNNGGTWGPATSDVRTAMEAYTQSSPDYEKTIEFLKKAEVKNPSLSEKLQNEINLIEKERIAIRERFGELENVRPDELFQDVQPDQSNLLTDISNALFRSSPSSAVLEKIGVPEKINIGVESTPAIPATVLLNIMSNRDVLGTSLDTLALAGAGSAIGSVGKFLGAATKGRPVGSIAKKGADISEKLKRTETRLEALKSYRAPTRHTRGSLDFSQLLERGSHSGLGSDIGGWIAR